jgi:N-acetylneuraminate synthase
MAVLRNDNMKINGREIGRNVPPYVVAELSANHNGNIERAFEIIKSARDSGADAIKIQTYTADTMTLDCDSKDFIIDDGLWKGRTLYELYKWAETPYEWHKEIFDYANKIGITCFSTPFDETAVDLLEDLNTPAYKVASFEIIDIPLLRYIATTRKPIIISTGMANLEEITEAVEVVKECGCTDIALLHCISSYPAPLEQSNLKVIEDLRKKFNLTVGLSDHTMGIIASVTSVALGASIIEKHFTLDRTDKGPDSDFSIEPNELSDLCKLSKDAWKALGKADYRIKDAESNNIKYRRSIYVVKDMSPGDVITRENIRRVRPGYGIMPKHFDSVIGKSVNRKIQKGQPLKWDFIV